MPGGRLRHAVSDRPGYSRADRPDASVHATPTPPTALAPPSRLQAVKRALRACLPSISASVGSEANYIAFADYLRQRTERPCGLIVGGGQMGKGMGPLARGGIDLVETDVVLGPRVMLACDAHNLPFPAETFDGVIVQAVLEHVVDPYRCADELHRVLKRDGLVYAETPFMQQVHLGAHDFTRFTHLGHRRLFRRFEEIASGAVCGPGMALAWAYQYFLLSFVGETALRGPVAAFARLTSFFLKYCDPYLIGKAAALDAASGVYFRGRKSARVLSDQELIRLYRGQN